jgi:hypothetical protein
MRHEILKLVQKRVGNTLDLIGNNFLNRTLNGSALRGKIYKWDYMK